MFRTCPTGTDGLCELLRLTGDVTVVNAGGTVASNELVVNLATNVSTFTSSQGGRVTGVFTSQ